MGESKGFTNHELCVIEKDRTNTKNNNNSATAAIDSPSS